MKAKLIGKVKKIAAVATGALFLGATLGMASVFASGLSNLNPTTANPFISNGHVNAVFVIGSAAAPQDIAGAIDISAALTAAAAATHSSASTGQVTIGTLALKSKSSQSQVVTSNHTLFGSFSPTSAIVNEINSTGAYTLGNTTKMNASWQESFAFSATSGQEPFVNGLNVVFPSKSFTITSSLNNRNASDAATVLANDTQYLIGSTMMDLISLTAKNATFGVLHSSSNVLIPSSLSVGTNTLNLVGIAKVLTSTGSINEIEFNINGGTTQLANLSSTVTVGKVTLTTGKTILENSTGYFLSSLDVSSASLIQNNSAANVFGFGPYNVTWAASKPTGFAFTYTGKQTLQNSFSTASSFPIMANLSTVSLQPLTSSFNGVNENVSVTIGPAARDNFTFTQISNTSKNVNVTGKFTKGLPNIAFGTDFRGPLTSSGVGSPDLLLEGFQQIYNTSSGNEVSAASEYIYPTTTNPTYAVVNSTPAAMYNTTTPKGALVRLIYELPNGVYLALNAKPAVIKSNATSSPTDYTVGNITSFLNYTAATVSTPTINKLNMTNFTYKFAGYNVTFLNTTQNHTASTTQHYTAIKVNNGISIKGPVSALGIGSSSSKGTYSIVPGSSGLFATNGTALSSVPIGSSGYLGNLKFNGTQLTYTDPLGGTQVVGITENGTTFATNLTTATKNTTANTWGDSLAVIKKTGIATIAIPAQNYTVALAGAQTVIGQKNFTINQTVTSGKLLGISGVSTVTASGLLNGNPNLVKTDTNFTATEATNSVPVIVMGGPAANIAAAQLLYNSTTLAGGSAFVNATHVHSGEALIKLFNNVPAFNNQKALLVAGYSSQDTLEASEVLASFLIGEPISGVNMSGNNVTLSISGTSYKGVTSV
jgi:hypothetical protein